MGTVSGGFDCFGASSSANNVTRQISGEDLFGDYGSPEVMQAIFAARANRKPPETFKQKINKAFSAVVKKLSFAPPAKKNTPTP